jgi:hypothetical protein
MKKYFSITQKSFQEYDVTNHRDLWNKVKSEGYTGLMSEMPVAIKKELVTNKKGEEKEEYKMTFSDDKTDRHGDIVMQNWDLKWFKKNPVLLDSHNYGSIKSIIGKVKKLKAEPNLAGTIEFALDNEIGQLAKNLVDGGFLNASSVGFIPLEFDENGNITKSELLEISLVSVPANPRATFEKELESIKEEIVEIEKELEVENVDIKTVVSKINSVDKRKAILNSIAKTLKEQREKEIRNQKRELFKILRKI